MVEGRVYFRGFGGFLHGLSWFSPYHPTHTHRPFSECLYTENPPVVFLEAPIKEPTLDFPSSAPTLVKTTTNTLDNREIWDSPKNFEKFAGEFNFLKTSKLSSNNLHNSQRQPLTIVKTAMNLQDNWKFLFSSKKFGKFAGNFKFLKNSKLSSVSQRQPLRPFLTTAYYTFTKLQYYKITKLQNFCNAVILCNFVIIFCLIFISYQKVITNFSYSIYLRNLPKLLVQ